MKRFLFGWVACLGGLVATGQSVQQVNTVTNVAAITTTNLNLAISTLGHENIGLEWSFNLAAATGTSSNAVVVLEKSLSGINWDTFVTMSKAANGTNTVTYVTNLVMGGVPFIRLTSVQNVNTQTLNNLRVYRSVPLK